MSVVRCLIRLMLKNTNAALEFYQCFYMESNFFQFFVIVERDSIHYFYFFVYDCADGLLYVVVIVHILRRIQLSSHQK